MQVYVGRMLRASLPPMPVFTEDHPVSSELKENALDLTTTFFIDAMPPGGASLFRIAQLQISRPDFATTGRTNRMNHERETRLSITNKALAAGSEDAGFCPVIKRPSVMT